MGKAKIFLFEKNLNLSQGRHSIKISKKLEKNIKKELYTEIEKEIDILINSFYGKEFENNENYYGEGKDKEGRQNARVVARNMIFMMRAIKDAKEKYGLPELEKPEVTNFIK